MFNNNLIPSKHQLTGIGTDFHKFSIDNNRPLFLAGLLWEGYRGLDGHSDADVIIHAMCNALLSAGKLGDIGEIFGVDLQENKNITGEKMLQIVYDLLNKNNKKIINVSVSLIGNLPKISKRRDEAEKNIERIIGAQVSLSAATTDTMGFLGRGEGLGAIAIANIY